jgi:hypothetical protein
VLVRSDLVLLGYHSERHWLRAVADRLGHLFPYVCGQAAYNRQLRRAAPLMAGILHALAVACTSWCGQWRLLDATPLPCSQSRERSSVPSWPATPATAMTPVINRFYWGLRLYLAAPDSMTATWWCLANQRRRASVAEALLDRPARHGCCAPAWSPWPTRGWLDTSSKREGTGVEAAALLQSSFCACNTKRASSPPRQR